MRENINKQPFELSVEYVEKFLDKAIRPRHQDFEFYVRQSEDGRIFVEISKEDAIETIKLTSNINDRNKFSYVSANTKPSKIAKLIEDRIRKMTDSRLATILDNIYKITY